MTPGHRLRPVAGPPEKGVRTHVQPLAQASPRHRRHRDRRSPRLLGEPLSPSRAPSPTRPASRPRPGERRGRSSSPDRASAATRSTRTSRSSSSTGADIARTGLTSIAEVLQRLPSSGGALNSRFNNSGNFGNPPDGGGVGAGAAEVDLRYLGSRRTLVLVDGLRFVNAASASGVPGSVDLNAIPDGMIERVEVLQGGASAIYGSDAIAGVVNIITKTRSRRARACWSSSAATARATASPELPAELGQGLATDHLDRRRRQFRQAGLRQLRRPRAVAIPDAWSRRLRQHLQLGHAHSGASSLLGQDLTLIAPVIGRTPPGRLPALRRRSDRFNFAPFNLQQTRSSATGGFITWSHEVRRRYRRVSARALQPAQLGEPGGAAAVLRRPRRRQRQPARQHRRSTRPTRSTRSASVTSGQQPDLSSAGASSRTGRAATTSTVDTFYVSATLDGGFRGSRQRLVLGRQRRLGPQQGRAVMFGNINAANCQPALGPGGGLHSALRAVQHLRRRGLDHPRRCSTSSTFVQRDSSEQELVGCLAAKVSGGLFDLPGGPLGVAIGVEHRDQSGQFDPDPIVAAGFGSDIPAQPTRGSYNVDEAYAEVSPALATGPFSGPARRDRRRPLFRLFDLGFDDDCSGRRQLEPIEDLLLRGTREGFRRPSDRRAVRHADALRPGPGRPCALRPSPGQTFTTQANGARQLHCPGRTGRRASTSSTRRSRCLPAATRTSTPRRRRAGASARCWRPSFLPRFSVEANYFNIRVDGAIQAIDAEVLLGRCAETPIR